MVEKLSWCDQDALNKKFASSGFRGKLTIHMSWQIILTVYYAIEGYLISRQFPRFEANNDNASTDADWEELYNCLQSDDCIREYESEDKVIYGHFKTDESSFICPEDGLTYLRGGKDNFGEDPRAQLYLPVVTVTVILTFAISRLYCGKYNQALGVVTFEKSNPKKFASLYTFLSTFSSNRVSAQKTRCGYPSIGLGEDGRTSDDDNDGGISFSTWLSIIYAVSLVLIFLWLACWFIVFLITRTCGHRKFPCDDCVKVIWQYRLGLLMFGITSAISKIPNFFLDWSTFSPRVVALNVVSLCDIIVSSILDFYYSWQNFNFRN